MLSVTHIYAKTGQPLHEQGAGGEILQKKVSHSFLEEWLTRNQINCSLYVAKFHAGVSSLDRELLERQDKVLVFTNGRDAYFTDSETSRLMFEGDLNRGISPIYAADRNSPHNFVAYGSLVLSDGIASTSVTATRILVIDDEARSHGDEVLLDVNGQPVPPYLLEKLYDKMGDGTMLVSSPIMRDLILPEEQEALQNILVEKGVDNPQEIQKQIDRLAQQTVTQFRASALDFPGLAKGTMSTSVWCDRLGVSAILSKNDIKGDDGQFSKPGLKEIDCFWVNRKSDAKYGRQSVGPQLKGCIPHSTLSELNPKVIAKGVELAAIAGDPDRLAEYYLKSKDRQAAFLPELSSITADEDAEASANPDWLYEVLKEDQYGQLQQFSKVNRQLDRFLRGEWLDTALRGIEVPSAMAQHHSQLMPWEVCNKSLPHGAIVAYYRSPFPNAGAAAIAINNREAIKQADREAYSKDGVAYLPPWTAKNVAITDFDRDTNGYFVGYSPTVSDLPQQIREQLSDSLTLPPDAQYEAGRSLFERLIQWQDERIAPAEYPEVVREFIELNAPERRPPEITKAPKVKHPWNSGEAHSAAVFRAWEITAENPTGGVANIGMTLQSFALEAKYASLETAEDLLREHARNCSQLLSRAAEEKLFIPDDSYLAEYGLPEYNFQQRIAAIAKAGVSIEQLSGEERSQFALAKLNDVYTLLTDVVNGPVAVNLQTAVDTAKSARGIDKAVHGFAQALAHKPHELRRNQKNPQVFVNGPMPTNTQEPIGWAVESINELYQSCTLPELRNEAFRSLFPGEYDDGQKAKILEIAKDYNASMQAAFQSQDKLRQKPVEHILPSLTVVAQSGRSILIHKIKDPNKDLPIWENTQGLQPDWKISISRNSLSPEAPEAFAAFLEFTDARGNPTTRHLGFIEPSSADYHQLESRLSSRSAIEIPSPSITLHPPFALENDIDTIRALAVERLRTAVEAIPEEERMSYASAAWRHSESMGIVLKMFPEEVKQRLQTVPEIVLTGIQRDSNEAGPIPQDRYTVRFSQYSYEHSSGELRSVSSAAILQDDGTELQFGAIDARSIHLPVGSVVRADISIDESGKTARMQVCELISRGRSHPDAAELSTAELLRSVLETMEEARDSLSGVEESSAIAPGLKLMDTTASECLYRFVNLDRCDFYEPSDPQILAILEAANARDLKSRVELLERGPAVQTILSIEFPHRASIEEFEREVCPLPIKWREEGDLVAGLHFAEPDFQAQYENWNNCQLPPSEDLNPWFVVEPESPFQLDRISSLQMTTGDHSFAVFPELMTLDIDTRQPQKAIERLQQHCAENPEEVWVVHATRKGIHAMRLDAPVAPSEASPDFIGYIEVDAKYFALAQSTNEWTARVTAKEGRLNDRISFVQIVGGGLPDSSLVSQLQAYQRTLVANDLDDPSSIEKVDALASLAIEKQAIAQSNSELGSVAAAETSDDAASAFTADQEAADPRGSQPKPYNPIAKVQPINSAVAHHQQKDIAMGELATQFIGFTSAPAQTPSSTRAYVQEWEKLGRANTGVYSSDDVVMVSGSGPWRGVTQPQIEQTFTSSYLPLLDQAIVAKAQILVGDAAGTDRLVQQYLKERGYHVSEEKGFYRISPPQELSASQQPLTIATDGACSGNPGPGGWGAVLMQGEQRLELGDRNPDTTNNRMEAIALIESLKAAKQLGLADSLTSIKVITDSQYVIKCATKSANGGTPKANQDLWEQYKEAAEGLKPIEFEWVRGHNGHPHNERADQIATAFAAGKDPNLQVILKPRGDVAPTIDQYLRQELPSKAGINLPASQNVSRSGSSTGGLTVITSKPVQMVFDLRMHGQQNPLPVSTCFDAMRGYGRCHTTRTFEPYKAYDCKQGDIKIAHAKGRQIAFRVGEQYRITPAMINDLGYQRRWAAMEKHGVQELLSFQCRNDVWGLKMEPLGDYIDGKIVPFPDRANEIYSPTRGELREWFAVVATTNPESSLVERIPSLGKQLRALYQDETGRCEHPPLEYRHPLLIISDSDRQTMQRTILLGDAVAIAVGRIPQNSMSQLEA